MAVRSLALGFLVALLAPAAPPQSAPPQGAPPQSAPPAGKSAAAKPPVYDEQADANADVAHALARAKKENRRVLIQWGANWCGWCIALHDAMGKGEVAKELKYEYDVVRVDVGRFDKNQELVQKYGAKIEGIPYLTLLDADGQVVVNQPTEPLERTDGTTSHDPGRLLDFLTRHQAPRQKAEERLAAALAEAKSGDQRVFLHFGAPWCGWCHRLEDWMAQPEIAALLAKDFVDLKIDTERMVGGDVAFRAACTQAGVPEEGGIPWFVFLDAEGRTLAHSNGPQGNVGFPYKDPEIAHFVAMLAKAQRKLTAADVAALQASLVAVRVADEAKQAAQQAPAPPAAPPAPAPAKPADVKPAEPRGVKHREAGALPGYTLLAPLRSTKIYLVDLDGRVVHTWDTKYTGGMHYLQDDGTLLRCAVEPDSPRFQGGGEAGRMQLLAWDGTLLWDWKFATDEHLQHHDLTRLPDGNLLFIAWQYKSRADAVAAGRHPAHIGKDGIWPDSIIEIEPIRPDGAEIVWEWHVWDHLIQDLDPDAENYGNVGEHPELLDVNADLRKAPPSDAQVADMKALGYIDAKATAEDLGADWLHLNAIDYHEGLDQIVVGSPHLNEIWILDHSTTSDEAAGHEGGTAGHGGDFLHRWGNPRNYGAGGVAEQRLFGQHNPHWIRSGLPGAGHLLVYDNGGGRPDGDWSSVLELALPLKPDRTYGLEAFVAAGPDEPVWSYAAPNKSDFFSSFISGAQRLSNGNTLICEGRNGRVFEVTAQGAIVWEFLSPLGDELGEVAPGIPGHALFRATRIPLDHPGLVGKELRPLQ